MPGAVPGLGKSDGGWNMEALMMLKMRPQTVVLNNEHKFGAKPPAGALGEFLRLIPDAAGKSIRMALEGRSSGGSHRPNWLAKAMDIRFSGQRGEGGQTILTFESYRLVDVAPGIFDQKELFPARPDPALTGMDLFSQAVGDIAGENRDSIRFDTPLLRDIVRFRKALDGVFIAAEFHGSARTPRRRLAVATLTPEVLSIADRMCCETPPEQVARIAGKLDMARVSSRAFALALSDGDEARGILTQGDLADYRHLLGKAVVATGTAFFRPSGRLLRIDAAELRPATETDAFFSKLPKPRAAGGTKSAPALLAPARRGVAGIFGQWPGDESDSEIEVALREIG